ncbi:MAG: chemotaxis response regulator protein-glutamate methylesterase [Nitrospiraceae bacterium]|nr:chemotaxis response regulator protein-glutamate methylesterase [Nitrospiraceae bacterium]
MGSIRVLIVDDSSFVRKALIRIFEASPGIEAAGVASTGAEAIEKVISLKPDVVTLDINMPGMDGIDTLKAIMQERPTPVLMLSQFTKRGADLTLKALELGAMDFVDKSSTGMMDFLDLAREIVEKVTTIAGGRPVQGKDVRSGGVLICPGEGGLIDVAAVGASTGGPMALQTLLSAFPKEVPFATLVVQHMPPGFTGPLARRLDSFCAIRVKEAEDGDLIVPGECLVAPAGLHMTVGKGKEIPRVRLSPEPDGEIHRPSVDVLFSSVAGHFGGRAAGILLTGMGSDGARGMSEIKNRGGFTIAQDEASSAIFGMPRAAIQRKAVDRIVPLGGIAALILSKA